MKSITSVLPVILLAGLVTACAVPYKGGARSVQPAQLDHGWVRAAPTPVIKQKQQSDCGLAALAMVAGAWGRHWTVEELSIRARPGKSGLKLKVLRDIARERGFEAYAITANREDLRRELEQGRPVLLGLVLPHDRNSNRNHFEVAIAIDPRDGTVVTIDPATGEWLKRAPKILDLEWKTAKYAALVVVADKAKQAAPATAQTEPAVP
jgi:ABC-type bacteriocin/lantibiotic exporter with double-glycine peptidase domain